MLTKTELEELRREAAAVVEDVKNEDAAGDDNDDAQLQGHAELHDAFVVDEPIIPDAEAIVEVIFERDADVADRGHDSVLPTAYQELSQVIPDLSEIAEVEQIPLAPQNEPNDSRHHENSTTDQEESRPRGTINRS